MNISELSLKRPILATVMNILIILFGIVGYSFLAVREYPAVDPPVVNVRTSYSGANSEIIENHWKKPSMVFLVSEVSLLPALTETVISLLNLTYLKI